MKRKREKIRKRKEKRMDERKIRSKTGKWGEKETEKVKDNKKKIKT